MLSDKLQAKQTFVDKRGQFETAYQHFLADFGGERIEQMGARLNSLLMLHAELVQAPVLYTLQSAAEVGFAHAQVVQPTAPQTPESSNDQ